MGRHPIRLDAGDHVGSYCLAAMNATRRAARSERVHQAPLKRLTPNRWGPDINPAISDEDFAALESSIRRDGIQIPLVVWRTGKRNLIVAGCNRFRIAKK